MLLYIGLWNILNIMNKMDTIKVEMLSIASTFSYFVCIALEGIGTY